MLFIYTGGMTIVFATSNQGKVASLRYHLNRHGVDVEVAQKPLDLIEPQANTAKEIARVKARQAWEQLHQPVLVDDSSFHIAALNGFPGPYIKPMLQTIGIDGILRLMEGYDDRSAYFISSLVYIDNQGIEHIFDDDPYTGAIALTASPKKKTEAWSDLHQIFIPTGCDKVLAELTTDQHTNVQADRVDSYTKFAEWLLAVSEGGDYPVQSVSS